MSPAFDRRLSRLVALSGSDPGFYILAVHSFVEAYLHLRFEIVEEVPFSDLLWSFRERLLEEADGRFVDGLYCLKNLGKQHHVTNKVRHSFHDVDGEEAVATTHLFVVFCSLAGLGDAPGVRELEQNLHVWDERTSILQKSAALHAVQEELRLAQVQNRRLLGQLSEFEESQEQLTQLQLKVAEVDIELRRARRSVERKDQRIDELRAERRRLVEARKEHSRKLRTYDELARYIENLRRFSLYTRTRLDYERSLTRLTPEQLEAVAAVDGDNDLLIRGGAGTGKSLVLIEALKKVLTQADFDFGSDYPELRLLLTFTRTLARYDSYIAGVLGMASSQAEVKTIDSFFYSCLRVLNDDYRINYQILEKLVPEHNSTDFFSDAELTVEIEVLIFGGLVTRQEYLEEVALRQGMRRRLSGGQRLEVWAIRDRIVDIMEERREFSKNYSRLVLLRHLESGDEEIPRVRYLFLDETQDLTAADLKVLRILTRGPMIMGGDRDQALYGISSPYARAGIQVAGRTKLLRTNFRNSCQIHQLAEAFRRRGGSEVGDSVPADGEASTPATAETASVESFPRAGDTVAFRDGPIPELYKGSGKEELLGLLLEKARLFTEILEYEAENIAVLVPRNREIQAVSGVLSTAGLQCADITEDDFRFEAEGAVRVSTLHSSKGLDFPVVLLFLPYLHRRDHYDPVATDRLLRNLVYVGLSRAMEHLCVFVVAGEDPVLQDVVGAFAEVLPDPRAAT